MIYISSVLGGPQLECGPIAEAVRRLVRAKKALRATENVRGQPDVEFQVYVPGPMFRPEFEGVRVGRFSRKLNRLMIQIAVPNGPLSDPVAWLHGKLDEGAQLAQEQLRAKATPECLRAIKTQLDELKRIAADEHSGRAG